MVTYPLNNVQYNAEDAELYNAVRMSGVWSGSAFDAEVTGNNTIVTIGEGLAWVSNTKFSGKVVAQKEPVALDLGVADPSYNRIDVIAIQFDSVENKTDIVLKKGVASSNPEIPARSTTESLYELYLYSVSRTAGSSVISKSNVTDLRDNREYCGYMQDSIKPGYAPSLMEHNSGEDFRFWVGTKAEYERQEEGLKDNTFCIITDDNAEENFLNEINNKAPIGLVLETIDANNDSELDAQLKQCYSSMTSGTINHILAMDITGQTTLGGGNAFVTLYKTSDQYGVITAIKYYTSGTTVEWKREISGGTWHDWGWVNPSMPLGVEYRTTEMYMGKAVYTKVVDCGNLPSDAYKVVLHEVEGISNIIRCSGTLSDGRSIPFFYHNQTYVFCFSNRTSVEIAAFAANGVDTSITAQVQIWYTKE